MENLHTHQVKGDKSRGNMAEAILTELERQGRTRYWLMKETGLDSPTVYGFLQGRLDCRVSTVERMTDVLGMGYPSYVKEQAGVPET